MKILTLVRSELARLTSSRMAFVALVALMTVPVIYGGLYLWGNADPYEKLDRVPAALVVDDTGATVDGDQVDYGRDAADQLLDDQRFGWVEVTDAEARDGIAAGTYDFGLTFPAEFSTDLASASGDTPVQASLVLSTDDANSYLSTTLAKQAAAAVQTALTQRLGESASTTLLDAVASIRSGIVDAGSGAASLADGAASASAGAGSLASGTASLASGAATLSSGLAQLDSQAGALPASASALASGASTVSSGLGSVATAASTLAGTTNQAATLAPTVRTQVADALTNAGVSPEDQAPILAQLDGLSKLTAGSQQLASGISTNLGALSAGAAQVSSGAQALSGSAPTLAAAIDRAASGSATLAAGAADASSGAASLNDGLSQLATGSAQLRDSLAEGAADVPETTAAQRAATAAAIADPVAVDQRAITEASNYGEGLAPFFISLSAWIGIYALFLLVRPLSRRALTAVRQPVRTTLGGWITPAALGAVQMLALYGVITLALGLSPANPWGTLGFMVLASITFAAIVLALNVWLGSVGQFLGLLLMVVQLVTAGGTFPWQTLPGPLAALHQVLPMASAVDGLRQLLYGGETAEVWAAVLPLLGWLVASLAIAALGARKQGRYRTLRELRPSPIAG